MEMTFRLPSLIAPYKQIDKGKGIMLHPTFKKFLWRFLHQISIQKKNSYALRSSCAADLPYQSLPLPLLIKLSDSEDYLRS